MGPRTAEVVLVGDSCVGKTGLIHAITEGHLSETYEPTLLDCYQVKIPVQLGKKQKVIDLKIVDTPGCFDLDRLRQNYAYTRCDAVMVCFSTANEDSLDNVEERWVPEVQRFCGGTPIILVGTKVDLEVSEKTGEPIVDKLTKLDLLKRTVQAESYIECSAKTRSNVRVAFEEAAKAALRHQREMKQSNQCACFS